MAVPEKIAESFEPHRRASETVVAAFPAMTHNQFLAMLPAALAAIGAFTFDRSADTVVWVVVPLLSLLPFVWFMMVNQNYAVVATDERTVVARSSRWNVSRIEAIAHELPTDVQVGPSSGFMYKTSALGDPMKIHWRVFNQVRKADARSSSG